MIKAARKFAVLAMALMLSGASGECMPLGPTAGLGPTTGVVSADLYSSESARHP